MGITDKFQQLLFQQSLAEDTQQFQLFQNEQWLVQRPDSHFNSNMHWISPGDDVAQQSFLQALSAGGFDTILDGIGHAFGMEGIVCYHLTFIGVSQCDQGYMHHDFSQTDQKAFNLIIPLILVENSVPELDLQEVESGDAIIIPYKYEYDTGILLGDDALHATSALNYHQQDDSNTPGSMRMMATIYFADVNEDNVHGVLNSFTQEYPPKDAAFLLSQRGAHWGNGNRLPAA